MTWPDTFYVTYDYDLADAVTAIRENGVASGAGVLATFEYYNLGRRASLTRGNGAVTSYTFDAVSRLTTLTQNLPGTSHDQTYGLAYNAASQIVSRTGSNTAYNVPAPFNGTTAYADDGLNQYTSVAGAAPSYDARGNLTAFVAANYAYDVFNRLTSATPAGGTAATLAYDALGRLREVAASATTRFLYDGADMIGEYNASNVLQQRYVHGPGIDEPLVWYEGAGTSDRRYLNADQLGSVVAANGASTSVNTYDEYGTPGASNAGRFQYTGQMWLSEAGLYHYKARAYVPALGRFAQTDPIGFAGGMNIYAYVANDPINFTDPSGLEIVCDPGGMNCYDTEDFPIPGQRQLSFDDIEAIKDLFRGGGGGGGAGGGGGNADVQTHPLLDPLQIDICNMAPEDRPRGYADFNLSMGSRRLLGVTGGVMIDRQTGDIYFYVGGGLVSPGPSGSATTSVTSSPPTTGWNFGWQINSPLLAPVAVSGGRSWGTSPGDFLEAGVGTRGASLTGFYSWKAGNICEW